MAIDIGKYMCTNSPLEVAANLLQIANDTKITPFGIASLSIVKDRAIQEECNGLIEKFVVPVMHKELEKMGEICNHIAVETLKLLIGDLVYEIKKANNLLQPCEIVLVKEEKDTKFAIKVYS